MSSHRQFAFVDVLSIPANAPRHVRCSGMIQRHVIPAAAPEQREGQAGILGSSPVNSLTVTGRSSSFRACREISPRNARRQRDVSTSLDMMNTGADGRAHVHIAFMNNPSRNATSSQQLCRAIVSNSHVGRRRDHLPSTASPHSPAPLPARFLPASN